MFTTFGHKQSFFVNLQPQIVYNYFFRKIHLNLEHRPPWERFLSTYIMNLLLFLSYVILINCVCVDYRSNVTLTSFEVEVKIFAIPIVNVVGQSSIIGKTNFLIIQRSSWKSCR